MTTRKYAEGTDVSEDRSIAEIRKELLRFGASGFMYGEEGNRRRVAFEYRGLRVRFDVTMPDISTDEFCLTPSGLARSDTAINREWSAECRRRWRSLAAVIKAKLVAVDDQVATFEQEFLAYVVTPDGQTVGERIGRDLDSIAAGTRALPSLIGDAPQPIALGAGK